MKKIILIVPLFIGIHSYSQDKETATVFKKRVLESAEVDFLASYYTQDGSHSAVSGGIGSEKLTDLASHIILSIPLNPDDIVTFDAGISAYSSASSSNINPFNATGASGRGGENEDDDRYAAVSSPTGTPWQASSGASKSDQLAMMTINYSHSADTRNFIWNADLSFSNEYDYTSVGFGGGIAQLFNNKNSEISVKANVYLDQWRPIYPTELSEYGKHGANFLNTGYFSGVTVLDQSGNSTLDYLPNTFSTWTKTNRNSYSASVNFSQVLTKNTHFSIFFDLLKQEGMLSTPYQRIYFADKSNFYIGNAKYIPNYESTANIGVYRLSDDVERLPNSRFKVPIGVRWNYYINEYFVLRSYYRYYWDNWGIRSQTASIEIPWKITDKFTVFPMYRYYIQNASKYYAPFETHLSTEHFYTSDSDLSKFEANQYGFGINYTDIFTAGRIWRFGLKNIDFRFNHYIRSDGLKANIATIGLKFILQ